jgi:hypothetical protein
MATNRIKRRRITTKTIKTGIETQAKDIITVKREITVSTTTKVITLNATMETLTIINNVEATVVTQGQIQ